MVVSTCVLSAVSHSLVRPTWSTTCAYTLGKNPSNVGNVGRDLVSNITSRVICLFTLVAWNIYKRTIMNQCLANELYTSYVEHEKRGFTVKWEIRFTTWVYIWTTWELDCLHMNTVYIWTAWEIDCLHMNNMGNRLSTYEHCLHMNNMGNRLSTYEQHGK